MEIIGFVANVALDIGLRRNYSGLRKIELRNYGPITKACT